MAPKKKNTHVLVEKDDGTRWHVVDSRGDFVYLPTSVGLLKSHAQRLADGLLEPGRIVEVNGEAQEEG